MASRGIIQVEVGPITNYGVVTRPPWSTGFRVANATRWAKDYPTAVDVGCNPVLKCWHLLPAKSSVVGTDATKSDVTVSRGTVSLCTPHGAATHLRFGPTKEITGTAMTSVKALPSNPIINISTFRDKVPPGIKATTDFMPIWSFTFGGGYTLKWGQRLPPELKTPLGRVYQYTVPDGDWAEYATIPNLLWHIYTINGMLFLCSNTLSGDAWTVPVEYDPLKKSYAETAMPEVPSATWSMSSSHSGYAVNVSTPTFPTTGYCDSEWIECRELYTSAPTVNVYPAQAPGVSATLAVIGSRGTQKKFRLTLKGDGLHTPFVQGWQAWYLPWFAQPQEQWLDISGWCRGGVEDMTADMGTRKTSLEFYHNKVAPSTGFSPLAFWTGPLTGQWAIRYSIGYLNEHTGGLALRPRMEGIIGARGERQRTLVLTAYSRWATLARVKIGTFPSLVGTPVGQAIEFTACWCGIPRDLIVYDEPLDDILTAPSWDLTTAPFTWDPNTTGAAVIADLCRQFGVTAMFQEDRRLHLYRAEPLVPAAYYGYDDDNVTAPSETEMQDDYTQAVTGVQVIGESPDGQQLYGAATDAQTEDLLGYAVWDIVGPDSNLRSQADVDRTVAAKYSTRNKGRPGLQVTGIKDAWWLTPKTCIVLEDYSTLWGYRQAVVTRMQNRLSVHGHTPVFTVVEAFYYRMDEDGLGSSGLG